MRIKKEYLILIFLIVILGIYLWNYKSNRINYELPQPEKISSRDVARLDLNRSKTKVSLENREGEWYIAKKDYRAKKDKVQKILDTISEIDIGTLISKSRKYKRYKLDNAQCLTIKAFDDSDHLLREIKIGKSASANNNNYLRLKDDPRIYLAKTPVSKDFALSTQKLRDKTVLEFSKDEIDSLILENSGRIKAQKVTKQSGDAPQEVTYWKDASGQKLNKNKVNDLLNQLRDLECSSFYQKDFKKEMTSFDFKVTLHGSSDHFLQLYIRQGDKQNTYQGISSYTDYPFKLNSYKGKKIRDRVKALLKQ